MKLSIHGLGIAIVSIAFFAIGFSACKKHNPAGDFPSDFNTKSDSEKVAYVMQRTTPDSVARFLCNASIGRIPGIKIDTLSTATLYAYDHYKGKDIETFQAEFDNYSSSLPLTPKMQLLFKAGTEDPVKLGYQLGLEYVSQIREKNMSVNDVEKEISEFKKACGSDTDTYTRFIQGFKFALESDRGKDLNEEIYRRFINY